MHSRQPACDPHVMHSCSMHCRSPRRVTRPRGEGVDRNVPRPDPRPRPRLPSPSPRRRDFTATAFACSARDPQPSVFASLTRSGSRPRPCLSPRLSVACGLLQRPRRVARGCLCLPRSLAPCSARASLPLRPVRGATPAAFPASLAFAGARAERPPLVSTPAASRRARPFAGVPSIEQAPRHSAAGEYPVRLPLAPPLALLASPPGGGAGTCLYQSCVVHVAGRLPVAMIRGGGTAGKPEGTPHDLFQLRSHPGREQQPRARHLRRQGKRGKPRGCSAPTIHLRPGFPRKKSGGSPALRPLPVAASSLPCTPPVHLAKRPPDRPDARAPLPWSNRAG